MSGSSTLEGLPIVPAGSPCPHCVSPDIYRSTSPTETLGWGDLPGTGDWYRGCLCLRCRRAFYEPFDSLEEGLPAGAVERPSLAV